MKQGSIDAEREDLRERAQELGTRLRAAVLAVFDELGQPRMHDQKSLLGILGLAQSTMSRLMSAVRQDNPLAVLLGMPGNEVMRQFLASARKAGVSQGALQALDEDIGRYDEFVRAVVGDRVVFDAMLSELLDAGPTFDAQHRARAFKELSLIKGVCSTLSVSTGIVVPTDERWLHSIQFDAQRGCRRLRLSGKLHCLLGEVETSHGQTNLAGQPVRSLQDVLLPQFSTIDDEQVSANLAGDYSVFAITGLPLSVERSPIGHDIVTCSVIQNVRRRREGRVPLAGIAGICNPPCEEMVVDAWLHDDAWSGIQPELLVYDTTVRGLARPGDPARESDRLQCDDPVQFLGRGPAAMRLPDWPGYVDMLLHACHARDVDPSKLRGFRVRLRHPLYGAQVCLGFRLPE